VAIVAAVAERGARPKVSRVRRRILQVVQNWTSPLLPDDYLEMINPLWSTRELRGRIERIKREDGDAVTVLIRPGYKWPGHRPGQYLRIGLDINGRRHWRAYSITSDPNHPDGWVSITPKLVEAGAVSPFLVRDVRPGALVTMSDVDGTFTLPDPAPERILFVTAGSGITPVMSMLRHLCRSGELIDVVHVHSARTADGVIFGDELRGLHDQQAGYRLHLQVTSDAGRFTPSDLDELCPDWRDREAFVCGPAELLDALCAHFGEHGRTDHLHLERFQPADGMGDGERGDGGTIRFLKSDVEAESDGEQPILVAGEEVGADLPYGCRMGICHTCIGKLRSGQVRDLRTGEVHGDEGEMVRTCIHAPEGPVSIDL
jgi:ferredoxin-NADP reductase